MSHPLVGVLQVLRDNPPQRCIKQSTAGPIPPELGQLAALKTLDLNNNQLTGESFLRSLSSCQAYGKILLMRGRDIIQICGASSLEVCVEVLLRMKLFKNSEELCENSEEIRTFSAFSGIFYGKISSSLREMKNLLPALFAHNSKLGRDLFGEKNYIRVNLVFRLGQQRLSSAPGGQPWLPLQTSFFSDPKLIGQVHENTPRTPCGHPLIRWRARAHCQTPHQ